jgi:hypothetical protein
MLLPGHFPPDSRVTISRDPNSPWSVEDLTFQANADPVTLKITAPVGVLLTRNQNFSPPLTVAVSFQYGGHT